MIERIDNNNPDKNIINHAVKILHRGGVLVIPTETAYGLAADATNARAVKKIYQIKGRSFKKFLPLIGSSLNQVKKYFKVNKKELELLKKYKGLSVVLEVKSNIYLLKNQTTCAVRISPNKTANLLAKKLGRPITATSANRAGGGSCYAVEEVLRQLNKYPSVPSRGRGTEHLPSKRGGSIDLVLDAGKLKKRKPSTIVKVSDNKVEIARQGEVKILNFSTKFFCE
ncbi:hypothetical protein CO134_00965 [Candidatus Kuenenbacteria bacterium CG_4_9_14_3_um_filter_39_14]|uniref:L-threonylcarbamoyladenylate synthase n=3 Tax=Candidatus Kueneniibacteriota TaxID=1752740 RepID=A0A2M7ILD0_9BACT|nr:MAG: hypothetical protein COU24_02655 [Candidatus Kuenenbacteria bacterium CG10_big_fil_rev_8_21_14_0_10_39_14]PIW95604.1 MAG: hypothetical protein COZ84_02570 [Candidatus Kuenenbacteria bacterium CG_4_8_14_3_um_filter_39_15]PJA92265.1 MAG: hypothetical protein CO134_00965 [Candidatus Kuenenbacteria bacterium CG_4_9_14_3_um_filter_39_14]